jgi:NAD(P)-dependent dehydrogenase (short-subunit alcohol dehydrogenase family)
MALDVRREEQMEEMARQTLSRFGRIDILVAGAGILRLKGTSPKPLVELSLEEWDAVVDTNLRGTFLSNRAVLPAMMAQRKGQIVNISSTYGRQGRAYDSAYCASKFGIVGLSEALAEEVRQYHVKVHLVMPDAVDTPLWEQNGPIPRPPNALPAERVADLINFLLTLPDDTILLNTTIAGFRGRRAGGQRARRDEQKERE